MGTRARARRQDPVSRPVDFAEAMGQLENADDNKRYVAVNKDDTFAVANYRQQGYEIEEHREGGVHTVAGGFNESMKGRPVEVMDCVLMSIDKKKWEAMEQASQEAATPVERSLIRQRTGISDDLRNIDPKAEWAYAQDMSESELEGIDADSELGI